MLRFIPRWLRPCALPAALLAGLCGSALTAQAQTAAASRPDPLDAKANVPALGYESPFSRYRPDADVKPTPWRDANDNVGRIGGWRAYAREAQQPDPAAAATSANPPTAGPSPPAATASPLPAATAGPLPAATAGPLPAASARPMPAGHGGHGGHSAP